MKLKITLSALSSLILFLIYALPMAYAGIGSGPFNIVVTAGNWNLEIIDVQFTLDGNPKGPLYNVNAEIQKGGVETIGPFSPGDDPNSLELTYFFAGTADVYVVPPDWADVGLELYKTYTMITAIGEPLTYPLITDPEGDTTIMVTPTGFPEFPSGNVELLLGAGIIILIVTKKRRDRYLSSSHKQSMQ